MHKALTPIWHQTFAMRFKPDINTGKLIRGVIMVRALNGKKQYRAMTQAEQIDYVSIEAW